MPAGDDRPANRWLAEAAGRSTTYDDRWAEMARRGQGIHGEADLIERLLAPGREIPVQETSVQGAQIEEVRTASVLDAGCGTGRVAVELARRGLDVVGVDVDAAMLERARQKAPEIAWVLADLALVDLGRRFDLVALAGNVMIFVAPGTEAAVVTNLARHLAPGGALVAGFSLEPGRLGLEAYDRMAADSGLRLAERWATWDGQAFEGGAYAVSVHHRP